MPTTAAPPATPPVQQSNPQQIALALKQVIESVYTDGISAILKTTQSTDGTVTGKFADGPQVYDFSISPTNQITYNEAEATGGRSDSYLIGYTMDSGLGLRGERLDAPTSGQKTPKCEKGKRCGGACVKQGLACRQTLSPQASQAMVPIRSAIASHPAVAKANAEASQKAKANVEASRPTAAKANVEATPSIFSGKPKETPSSSSKISTAKAAAVIAAGGLAATAIYLGVKIDEKNGISDRAGKIIDRAVLGAVSQAYSQSNTIDFDKQIESFPLPPEAKERLKTMTGAAKVYLAQTAFTKQGAKLISFDEKNNFSTFQKPDGSLSSVGSVGSKVITFGSQNVGTAGEFPIFEMGFRINNQYDRKPGDRKEAMTLIKVAKASYAEHVKQLPENSFLRASAYKGDGAGSKRQGIYEKEGFRNLPLKGDYLWAVKTQGAFAKIPDEQVQHIVKIIAGDQPSPRRKRDSTDETDKSKPFGKGHIAYGEKPSQKKTDDATDGPDVGKFVAALLKPAIRQVYSDVSQVANVELKGTGVTGIFSDSNGDVFQFEITASGQLTYKAATRKDAEQDQCITGMQCGSSCVPQGDQCNSGLSGSGQAIAQLAIKTLKTEELPSRLEVARAMGTVTKEFLRNPVKALKEGVQREAAVREEIKAQTGVIVPSQTEILKKAGQKMTSFVKGFVKKNAEEGVVNTAGLAGSIAGGAVAGPIGALAGDLGGALATRKAITDYKALQRAKSKLADDEAFKSAGALSKLKILGAATLAELKTPEMQREIEDNVTGDVSGWAIGNASAVALGAMGVNIPLKGAAVALATVPSVVKAHRRIREGEAAGKVIREAARDLVNLPKNAISRGEDREKAVRREATRKIKGLKAAAATTAGVVGVAAVRKLRSKD